MTAAPSLIVAVAANGVIGRDNRLPWHLPEDLRWFKRNTLGKPVIMGRRTWESLGRPLPGRHNIVLSRAPGWTAEGALAASSLGQGLALAATVAAGTEAMVIGGAALFALALPHAGRLYLTEIARAYEGDTWFPDLDRSGWHETFREEHGGDPAFVFRILERPAGEASLPGRGSMIASPAK